MTPVTLAAVGKAYRAYTALKPGTQAARKAWADFERLAFGWAEGHAQTERVTLNLFEEKRTVILGRDGPRWTMSGPGVPVVDVTECAANGGVE